MIGKLLLVKYIRSLCPLQEFSSTPLMNKSFRLAAETFFQYCGSFRTWDITRLTFGVDWIVSMDLMWAIGWHDWWTDWDRSWQSDKLVVINQGRPAQKVNKQLDNYDNDSCNEVSTRNQSNVSARSDRPQLITDKLYLRMENYLRLKCFVWNAIRNYYIFSVLCLQRCT